MISAPLVRFVLTAALRDKLLTTLLLMVAAGGGISMFLGSATITEKAGFALVFGAGGLRFLGVIGIVLFCCFYVRRCFETKEVEFLLSRPISRISFLLSHGAAFVMLATGVSFLIAAAVFFLGKPNLGGFILWSISFAVECSVMAVAALFFSMVLSSAAGSALATLGLYVLARLTGMLLGIAGQPPEGPVFAVLNNTMEAISVLIPRLDLMAQTSWLVYGVSGAGGIGFTEQAGALAHKLVEVMGLGGFLTMQGLLSIFIFMSAAAFDFLRREF